MATLALVVQGQQDAAQMDQLATLFDDVSRDWALLNMRDAAKKDLEEQLSGMYINWKVNG